LPVVFVVFVVFVFVFVFVFFFVFCRNTPRTAARTECGVTAVRHAAGHLART
jgi:hypothetical protein